VNTPKTLDELMTEYAERLAEIARDETPAAIARRDAKRKADVEREIRPGLRTPDGEWIEQEPEEDETEEEDEYSPHQSATPARAIVLAACRTGASDLREAPSVLSQIVG
jgi:hypothetical protein